jgi:hypothetical protein
LSDSEYADGGLVPGEPYYYVVVAVDESGNDSAYSSETGGTPLAGVVQATDDFESAGFAGGTGWSNGWVVVSGTPSIETLTGNDALKLTGGETIKRTLAAGASGGVLEFRWDVDNLDPGEEARADVYYDGAWHTVWTADYQKNGSDTLRSADNTADSLRWASVGLGSYSTVTQVRFRNTGDGGWDCFFVDDVSVTVTDSDVTPPAAPGNNIGFFSASQWDRVWIRQKKSPQPPFNEWG